MTEILGVLLAGVLANVLCILEALAVAAAFRIAFRRPETGARWFRKAEEILGALARRRGLAVLSAGLFVLVLRGALLPYLGVREPRVGDEFSYLLGADTFASGRLANPTHPMWQFFETMHVIHQPTYASMYPPAQALLLAAGKVLTGVPWIAVYASAALMCAAFCWMLQAWLPPGWALFGALLAALRIVTFSYWMNSYYGGTLAATAGALMLGALPRLMRETRARYAFLLAIGVAILANSRPYEGLAACLAVAGVLLAWMFRRNGPPARLAIVRVVLPMALVLAPAALAMGYYNYRVTGSPFKMPYAVQRETYSVRPHFIFQTPRPAPRYNHRVLEEHYLDFEPHYQHPWGYGTLHAEAAALFIKAWTLWGFYLFPVLTVPLIFLPRALRKPRLRPLVWIGGATLAAIALETWAQSHYLAPVACLVYVFLMQSMRHLRVWRPCGKPAGRFLVRATPVICAVMILPTIPLRLLPVLESPPYWCCTGPGNINRAAVRDALLAAGGRHVVIVRYGPGHPIMNEWVYNAADIDGSPVVWARDMGREKNKELVRYFKDRKVWIVEADLEPARISPYPEAAGQ